MVVMSSARPCPGAVTIRLWAISADARLPASRPTKSCSSLPPLRKRPSIYLAGVLAEDAHRLRGRPVAREGLHLDAARVLHRAVQDGHIHHTGRRVQAAGTHVVTGRRHRCVCAVLDGDVEARLRVDDVARTVAADEAKHHRVCRLDLDGRAIRVRRGHEEVLVRASRGDVERGVQHGERPATERPRTRAAGADAAVSALHAAVGGGVAGARGAVLGSAITGCDGTEGGIAPGVAAVGEQQEGNGPRTRTARCARARGGSTRPSRHRTSPCTAHDRDARGSRGAAQNRRSRSRARCSLGPS